MHGIFDLVGFLKVDVVFRPKIVLFSGILRALVTRTTGSILAFCPPTQGALMLPTCARTPLGAVGSSVLSWGSVDS